MAAADCGRRGGRDILWPAGGAGPVLAGIRLLLGVATMAHCGLLADETAVIGGPGSVPVADLLRRAGFAGAASWP